MVKDATINSWVVCIVVDVPPSPRGPVCPDILHGSVHAPTRYARMKSLLPAKIPLPLRAGIGAPFEHSVGSVIGYGRG
jgi:hypothetical protein